MDFSPFKCINLAEMDFHAKIKIGEMHVQSSTPTPSCWFNEKSAVFNPGKAIKQNKNIHEMFQSGFLA